MIEIHDIQLPTFSKFSPTRSHDWEGMRRVLNEHEENSQKFITIFDFIEFEHEIINRGILWNFAQNFNENSEDLMSLEEVFFDEILNYKSKFFKSTSRNSTLI